MQKTGEYNSNNAFIYNGNTGNVNNNNKYNTNAVRPVSEFQGNVDPFASFYKSMRAAYRLAEEAQEMILRANHQTDPKRAAQIIYDFVLRIDTLSLKLRMAVALGLMSDDAKAQCDMLIAKIKDEARGWRNYFLRGEGVVGKSNGPSAESL